MILVIFNFIIFIIMFIANYFDQSLTIELYTEFGFSSNYLIGQNARVMGTTIYYSPFKLTTMFTHMYIHAGAFHIISNMFFLYLVGVPLEGKVGSWVFMGIYIISGIFASLFSAVFSINASGYFGLNPVTIGVGASGAIFGVLGAFVATYPNERIWFPLIIVRKWPVWVIAGIYFVVETLIAISSPQDHIGHFAHIGGFIGGLFFAPLLKRLQVTRDETRAMDTLDFEFLEKFAKSYKQKDILDKIKKETEVEIRDIWLQEFMKSIKCPDCGKKLNVKPHLAKCSCGFKIKY